MISLARNWIQESGSPEGGISLKDFGSVIRKEAALSTTETIRTDVMPFASAVQSTQEFLDGVLDVIFNMALVCCVFAHASHDMIWDRSGGKT